MKRSLVSVMIGVSILIPISAQSQYLLRPYVAANGGGALNGTSYLLTGTAGQGAIGSLTGAFLIQAGFWFESASEVSGLDPGGSTLPTVFALYESFPNPSRPSATIRFALPTATYVTIRLYDVTGREARTLVDEERGPGVHSIALDGSDLNSGIYFCRMTAGRFRQTRHLIIVN